MKGEMVADWRFIGNSTLIDIESIKQIDKDLFEIWTKETKNNSVLVEMRNKYNIDGEYSLTQTVIDVVSKKAMIKNLLIYNQQKQLIYNQSDIVKSNMFEWFDIPPDCVADVAYNIIIGKYMPPKQQNYGCFWLFILFMIGVFITSVLIS